MRRKPKHYRAPEPDLTRFLTDTATDTLWYLKRAVNAVVVSVVVIAVSLAVLALSAVAALSAYRFR